MDIQQQFITSQPTGAQNSLPYSAGENYLSFFKPLYKKRVNRKIFAIGIILNNTTYFLAFPLFAVWKDSIVDIWYFPLFYFVLYVLYITFVIYRLHDTNHSGMWTVIILIPRILSHLPFLYDLLRIPRTLIDIAFVGYLLFKKGTSTVNDYGEKPTKELLFIMIGVFLFVLTTVSMYSFVTKQNLFALPQVSQTQSATPVK